MALAQQLHEFRVDGRGVGFVAGDHLDLAAPQTGGDLEPVEAVDVLLGVAQRVGKARLGQPEHPHHLLAVRRAARRSPPAPRGVRSANGHIGCSSRGGPGNTTTVGLPGTTTPGAVPTGSMT